MRINKIARKECKTTRSLWEEVFYEDSVQFTDYYFENKADRNIGYVIGQVPYDAMMFRTPYKLQIGNEQREISYLVGVATRKECRHRGYMRELLMHSFREMYEEKQPFTFLMPANPAIYEPFDFRYIYERDMWKVKDGCRITDWLKPEESKETQDGAELKAAWKESGESKLKTSEPKCEKNHRKEILLNGLYSVSKLQEQFLDFPIMDMLAEFANGYLKEHYNIYVHRDEEYYEMQLKESQAQNGDIYVLFEQGEIKAFFLYAKEGDEIFIQEVIESEEGILNFLQKEEKKKPIIMARIIHLEEMMKLVCCKEHRKFIIEIEDDLIPENAGIYYWEITPHGSNVIKLQSKPNAEKELKAAGREYEVLNENSGMNREMEESMQEISMHIRELAPYILRNVFINEIV